MQQAIPQRIHCVGLGEPTLSDIALALHKQGYTITGSDVYFSPTIRDKLAQAGLLPTELGWFPDQLVAASLDGVLLGRDLGVTHPAVRAAQERGIPLYSVAEWLYRYAQDKQRIVLLGHHELATVSRLIAQVLTYWHRAFAYSSPALTPSVQLDGDAPIFLVQADAYPSSALLPEPQCLCYRHHMGLISSSDWEPSTAYATLDEYLALLRAFADATPKGGILFYNDEDPRLSTIGNQPRKDVKNIPFSAHRQQPRKSNVRTDPAAVAVLSTDGPTRCAILGARQVLRHIGITDTQFDEALRTSTLAGVHV